MEEEVIKNNEDNKVTDENLNTEETVNNEVPAEDLNSKVKELEDQVAKLNDQLLRKTAEFENYKKRTEKEKIELITYGAEKFIERLLVVVDDFERSLGHIDKAKELESVKTGIQLIYNKLIKVLGDQGVTPIEAKGKKFDFNLHEAIMQTPSKDVEPETILDEALKGYMFKDKVIRHSQVVVSKEIEAENKSENSEGING